MFFLSAITPEVRRAEQVAVRKDAGHQRPRAEAGEFADSSARARVERVPVGNTPDREPFVPYRPARRSGSEAAPPRRGAFDDTLARAVNFRALLAFGQLYERAARDGEAPRTLYSEQFKVSFDALRRAASEQELPAESAPASFRVSERATEPFGREVPFDMTEPATSESRIPFTYESEHRVAAERDGASASSKRTMTERRARAELASAKYQSAARGAFESAQRSVGPWGVAPRANRHLGDLDRLAMTA